MQKKIKRNSIDCPQCESSGHLKGTEKTCPACKGLGYTEEVQGFYLYWGKKMRGIPPSLRKSLDGISLTIKVVGIVFCFLALFIGLLNLADSLKGHSKLFFDLNLFFDIFFAGYATAPLWLGIILLAILYFHHFVYQKPRVISPANPYYSFLAENSSNIKNSTSLIKNKRVDISVSANTATLKTVDSALDLALKQKEQADYRHLLLSLAQEKEINKFFLKLEIPLKNFLEDIFKEAKNSPQAKDSSYLNGEYRKYLLESFWQALATESSFIKPAHLLLALLNLTDFKRVLNKYDVKFEDFQNVMLWMKYKNTKNSDFLSRSSFNKPPHHIMNRSWSAVVTKTLDIFSVDITDYARVGRLLPLVDREIETRMLIRILQRSAKNNALLVGQEGSGRDAIIRGLASKIAKNEAPSTLFDKRVVKLDLGSLGSGSDGEMLKKRIEIIMQEVVRAQNVIIYIPNIHELAKVQSYTSLDIISFLAPLFSKRVIQIIGSTTPQDYQKIVEPRKDFAQSFETIKIKELSPADSLKVLSIQVPLLERENQILISYRACQEAIKQADQFIPDRLLPQKALDILAEAIVRTKDVKRKELVTETEIQEVFSEKTGIPITKIGLGEAEELLNLEEKIKKNIVGQEWAVKNVAEAIRRMRVRIGEKEKPIAVFLFLGPTGVGKTELAKTLAELYFKSRKNMIRIDMSEFSSAYDLHKMIGSPTEGSAGLLTEQVIRNPFSLILLDEFEKADPAIWDIFLQVFDDGILNDGQGRKVNFTNTIIIATSNIGSKIILEKLQEGQDDRSIKPLIKGELLKVFRPEFINRFDDIIIFNSLSLENIKMIARLEINNLNLRLEEEQGITIELTAEALDYLARIGYSPEFGARFLKRIIREKIEDALIIGILKKQHTRGDVVKIGREILEKKENFSPNSEF
jgi:ATP-dependent Clp protease ATP-binding subunit ClpC